MLRRGPHRPAGGGRPPPGHRPRPPPRRTVSPGRKGPGGESVLRHESPGSEQVPPGEDRGCHSARGGEGQREDGTDGPQAQPSPFGPAPGHVSLPQPSPWCGGRRRRRPAPHGRAARDRRPGDRWRGPTCGWPRAPPWSAAWRPGPARPGPGRRACRSSPAAVPAWRGRARSPACRP